MLVQKIRSSGLLDRLPELKSPAVQVALKQVMALNDPDFETLARAVRRYTDAIIATEELVPKEKRTEHRMLLQLLLLVLYSDLKEKHPTLDLEEFYIDTRREARIYAVNMQRHFPSEPMWQQVSQLLGG